MSSPFELFVAVIIMTFVVIIGTQMLDASQKQVCLSSIDRELTKFKINLEDTVNMQSATKFEFRPDNCYNESRAISRIFLFNDSQTCGARCGISGVDSCFILVFNASDLPNGFREKCLNIPPYTTFLGSNDSACNTAQTDLAGYDPISPVGDQGVNLTPGSYILRNVSTSAESYSSICIFRR